MLRMADVSLQKVKPDGRFAAGTRVSYVIQLAGAGVPCSGRSAAAVVALGKELGPHAGQHRIDIAALPSGLVQDQAGQPQRRRHRVSTPREAEMKDVMRGPRGFVVPSVDRFGVSEAVRVSSSGSGSRPCTLPPDICCL